MLVTNFRKYFGLLILMARIIVSLLTSRDGPIEVVSIIDRSSALSCLTKVHSIVESAFDPSRLSFRYLLVGTGENSSQFEYLWKLNLEMCFPGIKHDIKIWKRPTSYPAIRNFQFEIDAVFARFYIPQIWPDLRRYIYLDNDIVVTVDLVQLYRFSLVRNEYVAPNDNPKPNQQTRTAVAASDPRVDLQHHRSDDLSRKQAKSKLLRATPAVGGSAGRPTAAGFVFDFHPYHIGYKKSNFNSSNPLVQKALSVHVDELFLNGGVAVIDAEQWRINNLTKKAEEIININRNGSLYTANVGDQGTFILLLQDEITYLPSKFNMRRHPKRTVSLLTDGVTGIVHLAGTTRGDAERLCIDAVKYPLLLPAVVPLYLSITASFTRKCPRSIWNYTSSGTCERAVAEVKEYIAENKVKVQYNPGRSGKEFTWPPPPTQPPQNNNSTSILLL